MNISTAVLLERAPIENTGAISGHDVEVIVHIDKALGEGMRQDVKAIVEQVSGVSTAIFSTSRHHLLLVLYDPDITSSFNILDRIRHQSVNAQLVGPTR